jgi:NhaA family Na+:H+ antiporter
LAGQAAHALQPTTNAVILPLFAFVSALVVIPDLAPSELSPAFWGIAVGLPLGKIIGITLAGSIVAAIIHRGEATETIVKGWDLFTISAVAGIGFTVSLLMNELAFEGNSLIRDEGVLGVLIGSAIAIVIGGSLVIWRSRHYRKKN